MISAWFCNKSITTRKWLCLLVPAFIVLIRILWGVKNIQTLFCLRHAIEWDQISKFTNKIPKFASLPHKIYVSPKRTQSFGTCRFHVITGKLGRFQKMPTWPLRTWALLHSHLLLSYLHRAEATRKQQRRCHDVPGQHGLGMKT